MPPFKDMILIGIGASLAFGDLQPAQILTKSIPVLSHVSKIRMISRFYRTKAWPDPSDPSFLNAVVAIETDLDPQQLLSALHEIEARFGRVRGRRNAPRTLDLDLLAYGALQQDGPPILPHPGVASRDFVLAPLCDIAPDWRHPATGRTALEMRDALNETDAEPFSA